MEGNSAVAQLRVMQKFFKKSISVLDEADSGYRPGDTGWTVAQQLRHTAMTVEWFTDGVFGGKGFATDWEAQMAHINQASSLDEEKAYFDKAVDDACTTWGKLSEADLMEVISDPLMGTMPKIAVVGSMVDHTAHHRGALATYARVMGKEPEMPYGE